MPDLRVEVRPAPRPPLAERDFELCEHKGVGHPDSIADGACEAAAVALAGAHLAHVRRVGHFNVDKGLLIAGRSRVRFGGGGDHRADAAHRLRAGDEPGRDAGAIVANAAHDYLARSLRAGVAHFLIEPRVREGSASLAQVCKNGPERANDTSFGVGYAPLSPLETRVLALAGTLRSAAFRQAFPAVGDDFKIMGVRRGERFDITVALALSARHIESASAYFASKAIMEAHLLGTLGADCTLRLNALDDPAARDETGLHLTVTGLSAEMGDDGQVGRGNRVNGLITPGRPMSLEAAAGKNPMRHVGKIYNVLAGETARAICAALPELREVQVYLLGTIGAPLVEPALAVVEVAAHGRLTAALARRTRAAAEARIAAAESLTQRLARGGIAVF